MCGEQRGEGSEGLSEGMVSSIVRQLHLRSLLAAAEVCVQMATKAQKASVEPAEIERYERYNEKHGAKLASSEEEEAADEEW